MPIPQRKTKSDEQEVSDLLNQGAMLVKGYLDAGSEPGEAMLVFVGAMALLGLLSKKPGVLFLSHVTGSVAEAMCSFNAAQEEDGE